MVHKHTLNKNTLRAQVGGDNITSLVSKAAGVRYQLKQGTRKNPNTLATHLLYWEHTHLSPTPTHKHDKEVN